jgi:hypothetical protein
MWQILELTETMSESTGCILEPGGVVAHGGVYEVHQLSQLEHPPFFSHLTGAPTFSLS